MDKKDQKTASTVTCHVIGWIFPVGHIWTTTTNNTHIITTSSNRSQLLMLLISVPHVGLWAISLACIQVVHSTTWLISLSFHFLPFLYRFLYLPLDTFPLFLRVWLCDTYNWKCDRFYSSHANTLYFPVKGYCWEVSNGCMLVRLSSLCLCVGMCFMCSCSLCGCGCQRCFFYSASKKKSNFCFIKVGI